MNRESYRLIEKTNKTKNTKSWNYNVQRRLQSVTIKCDIQFTKTNATPPAPQKKHFLLSKSKTRHTTSAGFFFLQGHVSADISRLVISTDKKRLEGCGLICLVLFFFWFPSRVNLGISAKENPAAVRINTCPGTAKELKSPGCGCCWWDSRKNNKQTGQTKEKTIKTNKRRKTIIIRWGRYYLLSYYVRSFNCWWNDDEHHVMWKKKIKEGWCNDEWFNGREKSVTVPEWWI